MGRPDLVLIHAPSVYDFRRRSIFYGPISDVIPSSPVFEMYPVGFLTMAAYLRRRGFKVRIVNLALLMMRNRRFDPERFLRRLRPRLFGIDLHWLPHAHGSIEVAALLKRLHPDIPVVFGGISASYFHEELIGYPDVDFVLRGGVTEPCLLSLLQELHGDRRFARVPNLTWKESDTDRHAPSSRVNAASFAPVSLDEFDIDVGPMVSDVVRHLDFWTSTPFHAWWRHPITAVFTVRGCARECVTCGAADGAFQRFMPGHYPIRRGPDRIADQVAEFAMMTRAPVFLVGDLCDAGEDYARSVIEALGRRPVTNRIIFEFFAPPPPAILDAIDAHILHWGAELSPESHDEAVRERLGKARYTNAQFDTAVADILARRCEQLDVFYMIGLPGQTHAGVMEGVTAIEKLFARHDRRLSAFITPMGPFIDPGSHGFEEAERHGYRIRARTLAEHRALLEQRDWESILNYETDWMTRAEIVDATYDAAERLNDLKERYGRITPERAARVRHRQHQARALRQRLAETGSGPLDPATHQALLGEIRAFSEATVNDKAELFPPAAFLRNFRLIGILRLLLRGRSTIAVSMQRSASD